MSVCAVAASASTDEPRRAALTPAAPPTYLLALCAPRPAQVPLVVVTSFSHAVPEALSAALASIGAHNYSRVILGSQLAGTGERLRRGEGALVRGWKTSCFVIRDRRAARGKRQGRRGL
jgi:hypothetical protein